MTSSKPLRILIVEDDDALLHFFSRALRRAGHVVESSTRGDEGLRLALEGGFDLLVLDWRLPGMDGHAVLAALRSAGSVLRVLMLTGYGESHRMAAMAAGADAFLEKPCGLEELVAAADALGRREVPHAA